MELGHRRIERECSKSDVGGHKFRLGLVHNTSAELTVGGTPYYHRCIIVRSITVTVQLGYTPFYDVHTSRR